MISARLLVSSSVTDCSAWLRRRRYRGCTVALRCATAAAVLAGARLLRCIVKQSDCIRAGLNMSVEAEFASQHAVCATEAKIKRNALFVEVRIAADLSQGRSTGHQWALYMIAYTNTGHRASECERSMFAEWILSREYQ